MTATDRSVRVLRLAAGCALVLGAGLAIGGSVGLVSPPGAALVAGLLVLPLAVGLAARAASVAGTRAAADATVVMGCMWLHLAALVIAAVLAARALLGGGSWLEPLTWALASGAYVVVSWSWDRRTESDVDAVLEASHWYP